MHIVHWRSHFWLYSSWVPGLVALFLVSLNLKSPLNSMSDLITPSGSLLTLHKTRAINCPKRKNIEWLIRSLGSSSSSASNQLNEIVHMSSCSSLCFSFPVYGIKLGGKNSTILNLCCTGESPGNYFKILSPGPYPDQLNQNLWGWGLGISIYFSHMILMYNQDWKPGPGGIWGMLSAHTWNSSSVIFHWISWTSCW